MLPNALLLCLFKMKFLKSLKPQNAASSFFDFDVVQALIRKIDLYPIGTCLELSNGTFAVVLDNENQLRPVVQLLHTKDTVDLYYDRNFLNVVIKRTVPDDEIVITI